MIDALPPVEPPVEYRAARWHWLRQADGALIPADYKDGLWISCSTRPERLAERGMSYVGPALAPGEWLSMDDAPRDHRLIRVMYKNNAGDAAWYAGPAFHMRGVGYIDREDFAGWKPIQDLYFGGEKR